jgi:hypothetical protein
LCIAVVDARGHGPAVGSVGHKVAVVEFQQAGLELRRSATARASSSS